ncbi:MAG: hypothetical protein HFI72_07335 [Peptococcaceae bacterium]|nr:hypothetical protein [Peptococcaceae bacterium]
MANQRQTSEKEMKRIMKYILINQEIPELDDLGRECIYFAANEKKYITGIKVTKMASGRIVMDVSNPKLTLDGLNWLYPKWSKKDILWAIATATSLFFNVMQYLALR